MKFLDSIRDIAVGAWAGGTAGASALTTFINESEETRVSLQEQQYKEAAGVGELEAFLEDSSWREMNAGGRWNFTRQAVRRMITWSRVMYIMNPLIKRAVTVQELYVFGSGVRIKADSPEVQEVLDDCYTHTKNQRAVGDAWPEREREQRNDGNTFFVWFANKVTGAARVRVLPVDAVDEIYCNPEDVNEVWFYKKTFVMDTVMNQVFPDMMYSSNTTIFPDIDYNPRIRQYSWDGIPINWDVRIQHVKTGGLSHMRFGIPELISALMWATGYKGILENFAKILQAYARIAMKMTGLAGKKGVAAAKSKLGTGMTSDQLRDNNPPNNTAAWQLLSGNVDVSAVKTAGHTTGPDEARALRSMVAAGSDTPEHFFGDSDIGNFATSSTLDRPTELKMISRQTMWARVIHRQCKHLIEVSASAQLGKLRKAGYTVEAVPDAFDGSVTYKVVAPEGKSVRVTVEFPAILERDVVERVRAVVQAATLNGSPAEGIFPDRALLFKMLLEALGRKDAEDLMEKYYPEPVMQGFRDPAQMEDDEHLTAVGKKELGDAALIAAKNSGKAAPPKSNGSGATGVSG